MTSITWAGPRYVQELGTFLGPENRYHYLEGPLKIMCFKGLHPFNIHIIKRTPSQLEESIKTQYKWAFKHLQLENYSTKYIGVAGPP